MEGGAEVEGAAQLVHTARANPPSVVGAALRSGEAGTIILRRAVDVCDRTPLSPADRAHFAVSCMTVETYLERGDLSRAPALIAQLERDSGLHGYAQRELDVEPGVWIKRAFKAARVRHDALPQHERGLSPMEAMNLLPLCSLHLSRAFASRGDLPSLSMVQRWLEPYGHLPNPYSPLTLQNVNALTHHVKGELESARNAFRGVYVTLAAQAARADTPPTTGAWQLDVSLGLALASTPDSDDCLEIVERIEQTGLELMALECTVIRMLRHLFRGQQDLADELAERMEALLVQRPGGGYQNRGWVTCYSAAAYAQIGDAQSLQQAVAQLERVCERYPGHEPTLEVMRAALHRLRGELDEAERAYQRVLRERGPFARIGTALEAVPGLMQVLCGQQRWSEALDFAARALGADGAVAESERPRLRRALLPELAQCQARTGQADAAAAALDGALEVAGEDALQRFRLHAARAAVSVERGELEGMQQHLRLAGKQARGAGSTALVARQEALTEQLGRRRRTLQGAPT